MVKFIHPWESGVAGFNLNKIIYSNGKYVICGSGGVIITDKFSTIAKVTTNLTTEIVSVDYQDIYVALDVNGDLYYSFDAKLGFKEMLQTLDQTP